MPNLIDPTMAYGPQGADGGVNMLKFDAWIGGPHEQGTCTGMVSNVSLLDPIQPRYYPLYLQQSLINDCAKCYLSDFEIESTRMALLQAHYTHWPTVAKLQIPPEQIVENLVVSVTASNGFSEDLDTLMVRTINYAMTNYPPIIQDPDVSAVYNVGETAEYFICATDPDSHTISSLNEVDPVTGLPMFGDDMAQLIYSATLNGLPSYAYGPWTDSIIDQKDGTISFDTEFEGTYECTIAVRDPKGAEAVVSFPIYVFQQGTWLNHPPILVDGWDYPMSAKAGENITWRFGDVVDPDGESVSYSCNIGAVGLVGGEQMWQFQTMYPGNYLLEIVAYDTRGGYIVMTQDVVITPWWSN